MELVELTEFLVKSISKNPDMVSVKQFEDDNDFVIQVLAQQEDVASIIGKNGVMISSIRNIVNLAAFNKNKMSVKIYIDSF